MFDESSDELSGAERRAFEALPRTAHPSASLEERTVALLRAHGQLPIPLERPVPLWYRRRLWIGVGLAASLAMFATGMAVGQYTEARTMATVATATRDISAAQAAADIQRAGRQYVASLASLNQLPDSANPAARAQAERVALSMLGLAAEEVAHIAPDDPLAAAVLRGLDQRGKEQRPAPPSRTVIWF